MKPVRRPVAVLALLPLFDDAPRAEHNDGLPIVLDRPLMRRNDPCHCGSGRKFKACCLPKEEPK